jgi:hypothetical protein
LIQQPANVEEMEHGTFELQGIRGIYQQQSQAQDPSLGREVSQG